MPQHENRYMQLREPVRNIQDFLLSTYFADGLRITIGVLLPPLILAQFGHFNYGMTLSLGALCASVVDTPGPAVHRRNAMLITAALIFVFSILTGLTNRNTYFIGVLLVGSSFVLSMFNLYGTRAASIGTATLLVMVLSIDDVRPWQEVLLHAGLILAGALWYSALSYIFYRLRPYRVLQQFLSDSIIEVSDFLRAKARFYHQNIDYDAQYAELLKLQVSVHEKQEAVREIMFKTREIVRDSNPESRFLLLVFVDMVDLFEQVMSTYYNYRSLHEQFDATGILHSYERIINKISYALDDVAFALKSGGRPAPPRQLVRDINALKDEIAVLEKNAAALKISTNGILALKNIEVNLENILGRVRTIIGYFKTRNSRDQKREEIDTEKFITRQSIDKKLFFENLTLKSSVFRHSLRVAVVMLIGFIVAKALDSSHSYWILLTILVISKPGFSLTKQRNIERIIGTVIGGIVGTAVLYYFNDQRTLFVILLVCMIGSYSFQRKNYVVSVLFMTPYILILFDFLGMGTLDVAKERIYDTLIGSAIAFLAAYSLFPNWESEKLKEAMLDVLEANMNYFEQVSRLYFDNAYDRTSYKLARKQVYVSTANLASLFQRMFSEPKSKQLFIKEVHQFTALNHLLSSHMATLSLYHKEHAFSHQHPDDIRPVYRNTLYLLKSGMEILSRPSDTRANVPLIKQKNGQAEGSETTELFITEQFDRIQKIAYDIYRLTEKINI
ncbi:FUSC family protein [Pedobacter yulinensis]|uniref:FUSC family protein n=1 Tax=Pedobacter yulinensis TaxID=2126353 RepID=A0A2T3HMZ8_9SPHI|nr:FUSC family membrane protein [Pedobacter yulinensis]PST83814.1 FUSC family protein [Pedobacter yulinensis]